MIRADPPGAPPATPEDPDQTAPPPLDPLHGTPYRFVQALSSAGQMGEIVEAEHMALRRHVVVKLLGAKFADSDDFMDRMRLEAQAAAAISHANVVTIHDLGRTREGRPYLVMEKLVGRTLGEELAARGFLPVAEAVALVRQLLDGLDAAHAAGVVHRDIKPANLFMGDVRRGPRLLTILDFGVAKIVRRRGTGGPEPLAHPTAAGAMVGTPRWMAPEQILMQPVGPWTDVYSAGAVLYALVAGRDPFNHHRDASSVLLAHTGEQPPVPSIGAPQDIPASVERAIMKALEKRPEDRWASAGDFADALDLAVAPPPTAREVRPPASPAPAWRTADRPRTAGGGTAIQSSPRTDAVTPPHALALPPVSGSQPLRRTPWPTVLGAVAAAAMVGVLVGVALRGHRPRAAASAREAPVTAAPAAPSNTAPAPSPPSVPGATVAPSFVPSASVVPPAASARPLAVTRYPRRAPAPLRPTPVPVVASAVPPPAPPPPPAKPPESRRPFGVEE